MSQATNAAVAPHSSVSKVPAFGREDQCCQLVDCLAA
jgi:hypothetical protein